MNCPYCHAPMQEGRLLATGDSAVYWLPIGAYISGVVLNEKKVKNAGGNVLGHATKIAFLAKRPPTTFYCTICEIWIAKQES